METVTAAAPLFDSVTIYSHAWLIDAVTQIGTAAQIQTLLDDQAIQSQVLDALEKNTPSWFVHYDHGSDYVMWGDDEQPIIDLSNLNKLKGMHVYCMNCSSGKGLGAHAVEQGIKEYLGYNDVVSFTTDKEQIFKEAFNYGLIVAMRQNLELKDVVEEMRQNGYRLADQLRTEGDYIGAAALVNDMDILHVYYEGGPEPPEPQCPISRSLKHAFGWNGLLFFRKLRQRLFPEILS